MGEACVAVPKPIPALLPAGLAVTEKNISSSEASMCVYVREVRAPGTVHLGTLAPGQPGTRSPGHPGTRAPVHQGTHTGRRNRRPTSPHPYQDPRTPAEHTLIGEYIHTYVCAYVRMRIHMQTHCGVMQCNVHQGILLFGAAM